LVEQRTENPCVGSSSLSLDKNMKNLLWNMFANIQNGQLAKRVFVTQKKKKICEYILNVLWDEGFILGYRLERNDPTKLRIFLKYNRGKPVIQTLKPISKPGCRIYYSLKQIWKIDTSKTFLIISTDKGLKTLTDCKKLKLGGEPFLIVT
jgi:small subunit ribosomal protein S8